MSLTQLSIAVGAIAVVAARPRSWLSAAAAAMVAALGVAVSGTAAIRPALFATAPMIAVLAAAVLLAAGAGRAGLPVPAARALARAGRGSPIALFALVCLLTAVLTALVTLDGAVVLMAPVVIELSRRTCVRLRTLVLGVVAVANSFSLALPEGNPTNLVVMEHLGLDPWQTTARTVVPAATAALLCAAVVARRERRELRRSSSADARAGTGFSAASGLAAVARASLQVFSLLVVLLPAARHVRLAEAGGLWELLVVALTCSALAALANNLPASALVAVSVGSGAVAYAALAGLSIGALATRQGSVATLIAGDLTGTPAHARMLTPVALFAALAATTLIWAGARL